MPGNKDQLPDSNRTHIVADSRRWRWYVDPELGQALLYGSRHRLFPVANRWMMKST
jgi:hypothetical protein